MILSEDMAGDSACQFTADEKEAITRAISNTEQIIERYRDEFNFSKDEVDSRWKVHVLAEAMENLIHDMSAERLSKMYGSLASAEEREQIGKFQEELREQVRKLKAVSAKKDPPR